MKNYKLGDKLEHCDLLEIINGLFISHHCFERLKERTNWVSFKENGCIDTKKTVSEVYAILETCECYKGKGEDYLIKTTDYTYMIVQPFNPKRALEGTRYKYYAITFNEVSLWYKTLEQKLKIWQDEENIEP